jgi:dipeptidyl aminopeptidase/acylaminoacyl peptidase
MDALRFAVCCVLASTVLAPFAALHAAAEAPPAEAFGALPAVDDVALSPDGKLLAWSEPAAKAPIVVLYDLEAHAKKRTVGLEPDVKLRSLVWADNETLLVRASVFATYGEIHAADHYEVYRTFAYDLTTGKSSMLLMEGGSRAFVTGSTLLSWRTPKPKTVIMSSLDYSDVKARRQTGTRLRVGRKDEGWVSYVFEVDTRTGKGTPIESGTAFTADWVVNRNGEPVARSEWNPADSLFTIVAKVGLGWKEIYRLRDAGTREIYGLTSDEKSIVISSMTSGGRSGLWTLPLDGSSEGAPLLEDEKLDVSGISYDRITRMPESASLGGAEQEMRWLDKDAEKRFRRIAGAFKGKRVAVFGRSEDGQRVLARVETPASPPVYYFVDFAKGTADTVGEAYPALIDVKLGEVKAISYAARDGAAVPAYLTIPPGSDGKNLPLVVLPHGGPEARDDYAFDWWAQFLATRGYAVLQPQFRGSTGFGVAWENAGRKQWGGMMQDDVTDGVKAMIAQGVADSARICIVGASYGGYAALAGAAFTPELYRCAVSVNGVANLPAMLSYQKEHAGAESDSLAYWRDHIGGSTDKQVVEKSPAKAADQFRVPVMIMHAVNDTVVPDSQSKEMVRELEKRKKPVTFVSLAGEDHWLSQSATRTQMLKELDKFLSANLRKE